MAAEARVALAAEEAGDRDRTKGAGVAQEWGFDNSNTTKGLKEENQC